MRRALAVIVAILVSIVWLSIPVAAATAYLGFWQPLQYLPAEFRELPDLTGVNISDLTGILDGSLIGQLPLETPDLSDLVIETPTEMPTPEPATPEVPTDTPEPPTPTVTATPEAEPEEEEPEAETTDINSTVEATQTVEVDATVTVTATAPSIVLRPATVATMGNLRAGPGEEFDSVGTIDAGATVLVMGQDPTGEWLLLTNSTWLLAELLQEVPTVPVVEPTPLPGQETTPTAEETPAPGEIPAVFETVSVTGTLASDANLRSGPGTTFDSVGTASLGDTIIIVGQNEAADWYITDTGDWIFATLVTAEIPEEFPVVDEQGVILSGPGAGQSVIPEAPDEEATPEPTPDDVSEPPPAGAQAVTNADANLRSGPGTNFAVVGSAPAGTTLTIVGRNSAGDWYQLADDSWIFGTLVENPPANAPIVETP